MRQGQGPGSGTAFRDRGRGLITGAARRVGGQAAVRESHPGVALLAGVCAPCSSN